MPSRPGSLLIDALVSIAIFGLIVSAFSSGIFQGQQGTVRGGNRARATFLAEEALQAVRSIRDREGFAAVKSPAGPYLSIQNAQWRFTATPGLIDNLFTRTIAVTETAPNVLKVEAAVSWSEPLWQQNRSVALQTYVSNWPADPPPPPRPPPDWSKPILTGSLLVGTGKLNEASLQDVFVSGNYAFAADASTNGHGLYVFNVSTIRNPTYNQALSMQAAYDVVVSGGYAYLATGDNNAEVVIVDLSPLPGSLSCCSSFINLAGNGDARGLALMGTGLLVARLQSSGPELVLLDIGQSATSPPIQAQYESTPDGARSMYAVTGTGNTLKPYAYLATDHTTQELSVVSTTGALLTGATHPQGGGGQMGRAIAVHGTGAYLGVEGNSACEVFSFALTGGIHSPLPGTACGGNQTYDLNGDSDAAESANDFEVGRRYHHLFIATDTERGGGAHHHYLHILDIAHPADIASASKVIFNGSFLTKFGTNYQADNGLFYRESDHTLFAVGGEANNPGSDFLIFVPTFP